MMQLTLSQTEANQLSLSQAEYDDAARPNSSRGRSAHPIHTVTTTD